MVMGTRLSHEQVARFEALENRVHALEEKVGGINTGETEETWEAPTEEGEGEKTTTRRSRKQETIITEGES